MSQQVESLRDLQIWVQGFAAASEKRSNSNSLTKEQWELVYNKIMSARDASTAEGPVLMLNETKVKKK